MQTLIDDALVLKGGGIESPGVTLRERVQQAALASAERLFPRFADADHMSWETVQRRASEGSPQALEALGYTGDVSQHPVCKRIFEFVAGGKKGTEVQSRFEAPPFGWPRDAIRAALLVLMANGMITARQNGVDVPVRGLTMTKIGSTDFRSEDVVITAMQKIELRKLVQTFGIQPTQGNESEDVTRALQQLLDTAHHAGGDPPAPAEPDTSLVEETLSLSGNHRLQRVWEERETLEACHGEWSKAEKSISERIPAWRELQDLLAHAAGLPEFADISEQVKGIQDQRLLVHEPDPIAPIVARLANALRDALNELHKSLAQARSAARDSLTANKEWTSLTTDQQGQILSEYQLDLPRPLQIDGVPDLLRTLDQAPLRSWPDRIAAVNQRFNGALLAAARMLEPKTVHVVLEPRTLRSQDDVDAYIADVRAKLLAMLDTGNAVVVG
jgi:DNA-binding GntR family transcriptional regulator